MSSCREVIEVRSARRRGRERSPKYEWMASGFERAFDVAIQGEGNSVFRYPDAAALLVTVAFEFQIRPLRTNS